MATGYIDIKINKTDQADVSKPTPDQPVTRDEPGKLSVQDAAVNTALINTGKQIASMGLREYGNITGDMATVNMVDMALGFGSDILMVAAGGPVGLIAVGTKYTTQLISQSVAQYINDKNIDFMRSRMGMVAVRGSRYGE